MAHAPQTQDTPDVAERRRGWQLFLKASKWFSLLVLALVFFIIFIQVAHAPFIPTAIIMAVAVFVLGSIFR